MRIAIDIDSTLHHYWDQLAAAARRRFGVDLPYAEQRTWDIALLRPEQLRACVAETHAERQVLAALPYPGAVEAIAAWHERGHYIHVTSHRTPAAAEATARWLAAIGLPYDDLHCSDDKLTRCLELGIELLIDDAPGTLVRALDAGLLAATLEHPWNQDVCETEDVVCAPDWATLKLRLDPLVG
jgi:hypothetical protein